MKKAKGEKSDFKYKVVIISIAVGLAVTAFCVLLASIVMYFTEMNSDYATVLATACVGAGCFAAAFYAAVSVKSKGFLIGLIVGFSAFAAITLISFTVCKGNIGINTLFHFIIFTLASLIGGITGVNKSVNKKYI